MNRTNRWGMAAVELLTAFVFSLFFQHHCGAASGSKTVAIVLLDGTSIDAQLVSLGGDEVAINVAGKRETLTTNSISSLRFSENLNSATTLPLDPENRLLQLSDGSKLYGKQFIGRGNNWELESDVFGKVILPTKSLRFLLFSPLADDTQRIAWEDALGDDSSNDALIVVRATGELVRVGGTIREAKAENISFDFDDQKLDMPLERLKGISWLQTDSPSRGPAVEVYLQNGSILQCKTMEFSNNQFALTTSSGAQLSVPVDGVSQILFAAANVRWVADLPTLESSLQNTPPWEFASSVSKSALSPKFVRYELRRNSKNDLLPVEEQNLLFVSTGSYVFRMPDGFRTLQAKVSRPELASYRSELILEVWQEDEKLFSQVLTDRDDNLEVKVNVAPEKKTKLSVLSTGRSNLGTEVQWKQLRVLK